MKMIFDEVIESMKRKKVTAFLISITTLVLFFAITVLYINFIHVESKSEKVGSLKNLVSYQLSDTLLDPKELKKTMNDPKFLPRLKNFYKNLESNLGDKYIYLFNQPIALLGNKSNSEKFNTGYEDGRKAKAFFINKKGPYHSVKAIQMNQQAIDSFSVQVSEGENFTQDDFKNLGSNLVPVLLGAEYKKIYGKGDILEGNYLKKDIKLFVKGFIQPNTLVYNSNNPELYLDRYILMPAQDFIGSFSNEDEIAFQQKHYLQLINGSIYSTGNEFSVRKKLEKVKILSDFSDTVIIGANSLPLNLIFSAIQENIYLLSIMILTVLVVCIIGISILLVTKLNENLKNICIHLISGATVYQIITYMMVEILVMVGVPGVFIITLYILFININTWVYILIILACILIILLMSIISIMIQFNRFQISMFLRRTE
ncbi:ABC transporter [Brevibacillus sp. SYSU BS000544]|uniref:ABC transporter n=1 Tax=Brevibacillus sp. SYSU BS000544 TaxID=3416443 RepID=UPI003CE52EE1